MVSGFTNCNIAVISVSPHPNDIDIDSSNVSIDNVKVFNFSAANQTNDFVSVDNERKKRNIVNNTLDCNQPGTKIAKHSASRIFTLQITNRYQNLNKTVLNDKNIESKH